MNLKIYKTYNLLNHSYLAVLKVEQNGAEDPAIFVCVDRAIDTCPEESSTISSESSISGELYQSISEQSSDPSAYGALPETSSAADTSSEEASEFMAEPSSVESSESEGSAEVGGVSLSSSDSSTEEAPLYEVFPNRTLVAVASLTDLLVHPLVAIQGELYRADTVAILFRSKKHMNQILNEIYGEVRTIARLQRLDIQNIEVVELSDPVSGDDTDIDYLFLT